MVRPFDFKGQALFSLEWIGVCFGWLSFGLDLVFSKVSDSTGFLSVWIELVFSMVLDLVSFFGFGYLAFRGLDLSRGRRKPEWLIPV